MTYESFNVLGPQYLNDFKCFLMPFKFDPRYAIFGQVKYITLSKAGARKRTLSRGEVLFKVLINKANFA